MTPDYFTGKFYLCMPTNLACIRILRDVFLIIKRLFIIQTLGNCIIPCTCHTAVLVKLFVAFKVQNLLIQSPAGDAFCVRLAFTHI